MKAARNDKDAAYLAEALSNGHDFAPLVFHVHGLLDADTLNTINLLDRSGS